MIKMSMNKRQHLELEKRFRLAAARLRVEGASEDIIAIRLRDAAFHAKMAEELR